MAETTLDRVIKVIAEETGIRADEIFRQTTMFEDIGVDELDEVDVLLALEDEFKISITDAEFRMGKEKRVEEIVELVESKLK